MEPRAGAPVDGMLTREIGTYRSGCGPPAVTSLSVFSSEEPAVVVATAISGKD